MTADLLTSAFLVLAFVAVLVGASGVPVGGGTAAGAGFEELGRSSMIDWLYTVPGRLTMVGLGVLVLILTLWRVRR